MSLITGDIYLSRQTRLISPSIRWAILSGFGVTSPRTAVLANVKRQGALTGLLSNRAQMKAAIGRLVENIPTEFTEKKMIKIAVN